MRQVLMSGLIIFLSGCGHYPLNPGVGDLGKNLPPAQIGNAQDSPADEVPIIQTGDGFVLSPVLVTHDSVASLPSITYEGATN